MAEVMAVFIEQDPTKADAIDWSSVAQKTGIGMFTMWAHKAELMNQFRALLHTLEHDTFEFDSFPKETLIDNYSITVYAHKKTSLFKVKTLMEQLLHSNKGLKGAMEVIEYKEFPMDHPASRKQGVRIISVQGDQEFLDSLYDFPANFPFKASIFNNIYVRGGARRGPKDPKALKPPPRARLNKSSLKKLLHGNASEALTQAEKDLATKMSSASIAQVRKLINQAQSSSNYVTENTKKSLFSFKVPAWLMNYYSHNNCLNNLRRHEEQTELQSMSNTNLNSLYDYSLFRS